MLSLYTAINLSSLVKEGVSKIESTISADISDTHTYACDPNAKIDLWDTVPSHFSNYSMPLLFIVTDLHSWAKTQLGAVLGIPRTISYAMLVVTLVHSMMSFKRLKNLSANSGAQRQISFPKLISNSQNIYKSFLRGIYAA